MSGPEPLSARANSISTSDSLFCTAAPQTEQQEPTPGPPQTRSGRRSGNRRFIDVLDFSSETAPLCQPAPPISFSPSPALRRPAPAQAPALTPMHLSILGYGRDVRPALNYRQYGRIRSRLQSHHLVEPHRKRSSQNLRLALLPAPRRNLQGPEMLDQLGSYDSHRAVSRSTFTPQSNKTSNRSTWICRRLAPHVASAYGTLKIFFIAPGDVRIHATATRFV
jgi:hypothetical protein